VRLLETGQGPVGVAQRPLKHARACSQHNRSVSPYRPATREVQRGRNSALPRRSPRSASSIHIEDRLYNAAVAVEA